MSDDGKGNYGREEGMDYSGAFESDVKEEKVFSTHLYYLEADKDNVATMFEEIYTKTNTQTPISDGIQLHKHRNRLQICIRCYK